MSQVSLLSVDVSQTPDIKGGSSDASAKGQAKSSTFSVAMEQHYPTKKVLESDGKVKQDGNLVSKAATSQEQNFDKDGSLKAVNVKRAEDAHTLPVPLLPEDEALIADSKANDDAHTLPVPVSPEEAALLTKLSSADDAHTLPVPVSPEDESLRVKSSASGDAHTLPVPIRANDEPLISATSDKNRASDKNDAHTLPVPVTPLSVETVLTKSGNATVTHEIKGIYNQQKSSIDLHPQSPTGSVKSTESDDAVDLLNMLNGAQKLLTKTSAEQVLVEQNKVDQSIKVSDLKNVQVSSSNLNTVSEEQVKQLIAEQSILEKTAKNEQVQASSDAKLAATSEAKATAFAIDQGLVDKAQIADQADAQAISQDGKLTSDNKQNITSGLVDNKTQVQVADANRELVTANKKASQALDTQSKTLVDENNTAKVQDEKLANAAEVKRTIDNQQASTRPVNQSTASVVATSPADPKLDANQKFVANANPDKSASSDIELAAQTKAENDKQAQQPEKILSSFNQTLDAQAGQPIASTAALAAQQEQSFDSVMNTLTATTVETQKSITALNTETIAIYRKDFAAAVKDKVMVMINQKIQQVDIQLDPPEMGNVHVRVNLQNEQAAVQFIVQNQQAKDALEQNMGKLREMLAENGVDVGDANIEQRQANEQNSHGANGQANKGQRGDSGDEVIDENDNVTLNMVKASSTGVDYYA